MATFDKKMLKDLATLCRIEISEQEQDNLLKDLQGILKYVEQLNEIDTSQVPVCNHVLEGVTNVMREDVPKDTFPREKFLSNAPHIAGMIRIPPVLKQN